MEDAAAEMQQVVVVTAAMGLHKVACKVPADLRNGNVPADLRNGRNSVMSGDDIATTRLPPGELLMHCVPLPRAMPLPLVAAAAGTTPAATRACMRGRGLQRHQQQQQPGDTCVTIGLWTRP